MNKINLGKIILKLRKEKNITQEQLADMVGVSAGAVSKWETGNSTPDILLLVPLARALNTSLDNLFSFQKELSEIEVINIKKELTEIFLHDGYFAGEEKCKKYLCEYPNSIYLKLVTASLIQMYSMMEEECSEDFVKSKMEESIILFRQVAASREPKYTPIALFSIASIQMNLGNYKESEKAFKELPQDPINPMSLYPVLLLKQGKNKDAAIICSRMLLQYLNNSSLMLTILSNIAKEELNYEKAAFFLDAAYKLQNTFKIGLNSASYNYVKLNIELGTKELAAKWFKKHVEEVLAAGYDYSNNPYFNEIELEINPENQKIIRKKFLQSLIDEEELKCLSGILDYEESIKKLKNVIATMN